MSHQDNVPITWEWIGREQRCDRGLAELSEYDAEILAKEFDGLHWWLQAEVLEKARRSPLPAGSVWARIWARPLPALPRVRGSCWIVFVYDGPRKYPLLRDALLLPLRWVPHATRSQPGHSSRLPANLHTMANEVIGAVSDPRDHERRWTLELAEMPSLQRFDFRQLSLGLDSGWASLTSGLLVAIHGGRVQPEIWVSAAWKAEALAPVGGLEEKIALAEAWGAEQFFVAPGQEVEANRIVQRKGWTLRVHRLGPRTNDASPRHEPKAETALKPLTEAFEIRPTRDDPLEARSDWYLSYAETSEANDYYDDYLIDEIATRCRDVLEKQEGPDALAGARLVTILSTSRVALLGAMIVRPEACLVLYTDDDPQLDRVQIRQMKGRFERKLQGAVVPFARFRKKDPLKEKLLELVTEFTDRYPRGPLIFDVNSGTSRMKFHLVSLAPHGSRLLLIDHDFSAKRGRVIPSTETCELLPRGFLAS